MSVKQIEVHSKALDDNPFGDPANRTLHLVLPEDHDPTIPIPLVWWLAGYGGVGRNMLSYDGWQEGLEQRLIRLRREGKIGPMAVALPDAFTRLGGCQYLSSPAVGAYEDYLWKELPAAVAKEMAVGAQGVAGKSSGGYGALMAVMREDRPLQAVACHSGDMGFDLSLFPDLPHLMNALRDHGSVQGILDAQDGSLDRKGRWFMPLSMLAMSAIYSPVATEALGIGLPFDPETGALIEERLNRWLALDPVRLVASSSIARERLRRLELLYLDCGLNDEHALHWGARQFSKHLQDHNVLHEHYEFPGGHRSTAHRLDVSIPKLYKALS